LAAEKEAADKAAAAKVAAMDAAKKAAATPQGKICSYAQSRRVHCT
jgi:hypothetical protein